MFETKLNKINAMIEDNNGAQVKWNELLKEFSGQEFDRMVLAFSMLSPNQIDLIIDSGKRAKERAKIRSFEAMKTKLLNEGVDMDEFVDYVSKPAPRKTSDVPRMDKETRKIVDEKVRAWVAEGFDRPKAVQERLEKEGFHTTYTTIANKTLKFKKELESAA